MGFVSQAYDIWSNIQEQRAANDEAQRQQNMLDATLEAEEIRAQAETLIRDPSVGQAGYNRLIRQFIQNSRQYLSPEDTMSIAADLYAPYRELMSEEARALNGTFDELYDTHTNQITSQLTIALGSQLYRIRNLTDPAEQQTAVNQYITDVQTQLNQSGLPPFMQMQVLDRLIASLADATDESNSNIAAIDQSLRNLQAYYQDYQTQVVPLLNQNDYRGASVIDGQLRAKYQITGDTPWSDPYYNQDQIQRGIDLNNRGREAVEAGVIDARRLRGFERGQVMTMALAMFQDPTLIDVYQNTPGYEENPFIIQAISLATALREYTNWQNSGSPQIRASYAQRRAQIQEEAQRLRLQYLQQGSTDTTELIRSIVFMRQVNSGILEYYEGNPDPGGQGEMLQGINAEVDAILGRLQSGNASPEEIANATNEILASLEQQSGILNTLEQAELNQIAEVENILRQWGVSSPEQLRARAEQAAEDYVTLTNELAEWEASQRADIVSATPNFNMPQLDTFTFGSTEAVVPFFSGQLAQFSDPHTGGGQAYGAPRPGRSHAGVDFSVPVGTPIVSYIQGRVIATQYNAGGFGHYIVIQAADGTRHLFADLNDTQVVVGQEVLPGQQIGLSGNSGNGQAHLHWGIYRAGTTGYGYEDSINPYEYTAQLVGRNIGRNPTPVIQNETSLTNYYAPSTRSDYLTSSGGLGNDGAGNFGYQALATDRPFRIALHRTASRVGIPAQWLADIIAFETGGTFDPSIRNGIGATGLIQFFDESGRKTIGGRTYTMSQIASMDRVSQLELVGAYLEERLRFSGGSFDDVWDVLLAVWASPRVQERYHREGYTPALGRIGDGNTNFDWYTQELGRHAGRRYQSPGRVAPVHTRLTAGCPICSQMTAATFQRHEAQS